MNPASVRCENGKVKAVVFDRNVLGDDPEDGSKPPIHRVEGSEYEVPCDTLIYAVGQTRTLEILPEGVELVVGTHASVLVKAGTTGAAPPEAVEGVPSLPKALSIDSAVANQP